MTIDMLQANKAIQDTRLLVPRTEDIRKELNGCHCFSKLDIKLYHPGKQLIRESRQGEGNEGQGGLVILIGDSRGSA